ncbi:DUF1304 family protein [Longispora albida]|uniref:DUF1304 family protein n=1 Tax=Longispora albida TaxID=203523 RepID=UPI000476967C|nr:DUF1304 family protein [Longispora albida]
MSVVSQTLAVIAALIHLAFFVFESLWFDRPRVYHEWVLYSSREVDVARPFAFNQGFYHLMFAGGCLTGVGLLQTGLQQAGQALVIFTCVCMVGAGTVLIASEQRLVRAGLIQAVPPLLALVAAALL